MFTQPMNPYNKWKMLIVTIMLSLCIYQPAWAANPPPVQTFYIPFPEDQVFTALEDIYPGPEGCGVESELMVEAEIDSYVSIASISNNTIIYYDHWEDGFEADIANPTQSSTEIWGDNDASNGQPPNASSDLIDSGTVIVITSTVDAANVTALNANGEYPKGGRDKLAGTKTLALTRAAWSQGLQTRLAGALEIYDQNNWGTHYQAPVGQNTDAFQMFEYTAFTIMASQDNTQIQIDADNDGSFEKTFTLNQGESHLEAGGVNAGAMITASAPVQAALITGDFCAQFESRWFTLLPKNQWTGSYYGSVGTQDEDATSVFLHNPDTTQAIEIFLETNGGTVTPINVPPGGTVSTPIPDNSGSHLFTTDGAPFLALATIDSNGPTDIGNSQRDWGFTLIPDDALTSQVLIGWGPGRDPTSNREPLENGSPVWITPVWPPGASGSVKVCADYNGDKVTDEEKLLAPFEIGRFLDPDGDQTGTFIYVCDDSGAKLAAAWGQDPNLASSIAPGLDLGTTIPPAPSFAASKSADLLVDEDGDGEADLGDTLLYTIIVRNSSRVPIDDLIIEDTLSPYTTYVVGTTQMDSGGGFIAVADAGTTAFPLDEGGLAIDMSLPAESDSSEGVLTLSFQVTINQDIPDDVISVTNSVIARTPDEEIPTDVTTPLDFDPSIDLEKFTNGPDQEPQDADTPPGPTIVSGSPVTWTYVLTNTGRVTLTNVSVTDSVDGVTPAYVSGDLNDDDILDVGEVWTYIATGIATDGPYTNTGSASGTDSDGDEATDTDDSHYAGGIASMEVVKTSSDDEVRTGSVVTYTYEAINTGTLPITITAVTDNRCSPIEPINNDQQPPNNVGDSDTNSRFDSGETWLYFCSMVVTEDIANTVTISGTDPTGKPVTPPEDTITVTVYSPGLDIEKFTAGPGQAAQDADEPMGPIIPVGDAVTWTYLVTNTGDIELANVKIEDNVLGEITNLIGGDDNSNNLLDVGEVWTYEATGEAILSQYSNIGTVTAEDPDGGSVSDGDPSHYFGGISRMKVVKVSDLETVKASTTVNYTYTVSNDGNLPLDNIQVTDDLCSPVQPITNNGQNVGDIDGNGLLDIEEIWLYGCTTVIDEDTTNTVTVTGDDPTGKPTDPVTDTVTVDVVTPGIVIEKFTNGPGQDREDADSAPGPNIAIGSNVRWTYIVSNTGDVPLTDINVTDSVTGVMPAYISGDDNSDGVLDVGESWTYQAVGRATQDQYENIGTVTANDPFGDPITDDDPSHYFGTKAALDVVKTSSQVTVKPGTLVDYTYAVSNIGNVPLLNIAIMDDRCVPVRPVLNDAGKNAGDADGNDLLDLTELWQYSCSMVLEEDTTNVVIVTGEDPDGNPTDPGRDDVTVDVVVSGIDIEKSTGSAEQPFQDADQPNGPVISVGEIVRWRYEVRNTGDIPLFNVVVTDDDANVTPVYVEGDTNGDNNLDVDEVWIYTASGTAERDLYKNISTVTADDSFGDQVTDEDPSHYFGGVSAIKVDKTVTQGIIKPNTAVIYDYLVSNIGNLAIDVTDISDDHCSPVVAKTTNGQNVGDTDGDGLLDVNEFWAYSCQATLTETTTNVVTVTGKDPQGKDVPPAQDDEIVTVVAPGISIEKSTGTADKEPQDADEAPGLIIMTGDTVIWRYVVENTGDIVLRNVNVTDSVPGVIPEYVSGDTNNDGALDLDETWIFEATGPVTLGQYENTGNVTATDTFGDPISDDDKSHYFGGEAKLAVVKTSDRQEVKEGMPVIYTYEVSNVGNVAIANVVATDDRCTPVMPTLNASNLNVGDTNQDELLDVDEVWTFTCTTTLTETTTNVVKVDGDDPDGDPIDPPTDDKTVTIVTSGIAIEKFTSCAGETDYLGGAPACATPVDADYPPGPTIPNGDTVTWHYEVRNIGDVPLANVVVQDNIAGVVPTYVDGDTNGDNLLDTNEVWRYEATGTAIVGQYNNVGSVTADDPFGDPVTGDDPSHYLGGKPGMAVDKTASEEVVAPGTEVVYTYKVRNTGNVPITIDTITDDRCSPVEQTLSPALLNVGDTKPNNKLDINETWVYTCAMIIDEETTNVVTVTGTDPGGKPVDPATDEVTVRVVTPELEVIKQDVFLLDKYGGYRGQPDGKPSVGDTVGYTVTITNRGQVPALNVVFYDELDINARLVIGSVRPSQGTVHTGMTSGDQKVNVQVGDIAPGEVVTITYQVIIGRQLVDSIIDIQDQLLMDVTHLSNQGKVTADNLNHPIYSDDPDTPEVGDATTTWLIFISQIDLDMYTSTDGQPATCNLQPATCNPFIAPGETVVWTYEVYNNGNLALYGVNVSDSNSQITPQYVRGDTNGNNVLDPDERWIYQATGISKALTNGVYENTGHVTVTDNSGSNLSASDSSGYNSGQAALNVVKSVDQSVVLPETQVTYRYHLHNSGTHPIWITDISDDGCNAITPVLQSGSQQLNLGDNNQDRWITPGESWSYTCGATIFEDTTSTVRVSGINPASVALPTAQASVTVMVDRPTVLATQSVALVGDNDDDGRYDPGDTVRYEVIVSNESFLAARSISLRDLLPAELNLLANSVQIPQGTILEGQNSGDTNLVIALGNIAPDSSVTVRFDAQISNQIPAGVSNVSNQAIIIGPDIPEIPADDLSVDGFFDASTFALDFQAAVSIETTTQGTGQAAQDADETPGPTIKSGTPVTWTYTIRNMGNVALSDVQVEDDMTSVEPVYMVGDNNDNTLLDLGEIWVYQAIGTAQDNAAANGQYANLGTVTASYNDTVVEASDPSHYMGGAIALGVATTVNGLAGESVSVQPNSSVTFQYAVSNQGVQSLNITSIDADQCSSIAPMLDISGFNQGDGDQDSRLGIGETWLYECQMVVTQEVVNNVVVEGQTVEGIVADSGEGTVRITLEDVPTATPTATLISTPTATATATALPTATPTTSPTANSTPTTVGSTVMPTVVSATPTATPTPTSTPTTADSTAIPTVVSATPTATQPSVVATALPTVTSVQATATQPSVVATALPTATSVQATATSITPVSTPILPTATPTATRSEAPDGPIIMAGADTVAPGDIVDVTLGAFNLEGSAAATLNVSYDPSILRVLSCNTSVSDFEIVQCNKNYSSDTVRFTLASNSGVSGNVLLVEISFEAIGQNSDESAITIELDTINDANGNPQEATTSDGRVIISSQRMGDVNCDGKRNTVDALFTLQYDVALREGSDTCTQPSGNARILYEPVCDVSEDERCGTVDALFTLQCDVGINNRTCNQVISAQRSAVSSRTSASILQPSALTSGGWMDAGVIPAGATGTVVVPVNLHDADRLSAASVEVHYDPALLEIKEPKCSMTDDERLDIGLCNPDYAPGVVRFNLVSTNGISGDMQLATLTFAVRETLSEDIHLGIKVDDDTTDAQGTSVSVDVSEENIVDAAGDRPETSTDSEVGGENAESEDIANNVVDTEDTSGGLGIDTGLPSTTKFSEQIFLPIIQK